MTYKNTSQVFKILSILGILLFISCNLSNSDDEIDINYKQEMRDFVKEISNYSRSIKSGFIIIPQNGVELLTQYGEENGNPKLEYLESINGIGQEDLLYGYNNDDQVTPAVSTLYIQSFLDMAKSNEKVILVTDYCSSTSFVNDSYQKNTQNSYISYAANHRELDNIPEYPNPIINENANNITSLDNIKNFLYLINPSEFASKQSFINAVKATNYDLLIMDYFFNDEEFSESELIELRNKINGGKRLLISYLSIGEAEDYRYYWQSAWSTNPPAWMSVENPDWEGNYKVKYWNQDWKNIIYNDTNSYLDKIINLGFDGVYLDIIDAFEYFENQ